MTFGSRNRYIEEYEEENMNKIGFDNEKYLQMQSDKIRERIGQFGGKLYLEFGGKLFDDYHAANEGLRRDRYRHQRR